MEPTLYTNYDNLSSTIAPSLDDFLNSDFKRIPELCIWCPIFYIQYTFDNFVEKLTKQLENEQLAKQEKIAKQKETALKTANIKTTVRSYRRAFNMFNNRATHTTISPYGGKEREEIKFTRNRILK